MINKDRLHELADIIEKLPSTPIDEKPKQHGFNMGSMFFECESPACISGWIRELYYGEEVEIRHVGDLVGITEFETTVRLFMPETETAHYAAKEGEPGFITPERAANTLRYLAETGEVDWDAPKVDIYAKNRVLEHA